MSTLHKNLRKFRLAKEFTQQQIADTLEISRTSYIAMEQGKREPTLPEVERLGRLLGLTVEELSSAFALPDYVKYLDMFLAFLSHNFRDKKIPKTKLAKLLYLADFAWFYEQLEPMSGMSYRKIEYGPVPDQFFRALNELEEKGLISIENKDYRDGTTSLISLTRGGERKTIENLSIKEQKLITRISQKWESKNTNEIVRFTHEQLPYKISFDGEIISYALITQEDTKYVY